MIPLFLLVVLLLNGCGEVTAANSIEEVTVEPVCESIELSEVRAPKYEEDFATLYSGSTSLVIYWGTGGDSYMWAESGYPGFEYPMVIQTSVCIDERACVVLQTQWGRYEYKISGSGIARNLDNELIDMTTRKPLVNWWARGERLVLWNCDTGNYSIYDLCGGTEIVLQN